MKRLVKKFWLLGLVLLLAFGLTASTCGGGDDDTGGDNDDTDDDDTDDDKDDDSVDFAIGFPNDTAHVVVAD